MKSVFFCQKRDDVTGAKMLLYCPACDIIAGHLFFVIRVAIIYYYNHCLHTLGVLLLSFQWNTHKMCYVGYDKFGINLSFKKIIVSDVQFEFLKS